jgi:hypothetical protein
MLINLQPAWHKIRRELFGHRTISSECVETRELHPPETVDAPAAWFDEGDLQRITDFGHKRNGREIEMARIRGGLTTRQPTMAYRLRDAMLVNGFLMTRTRIHRLAHEAPTPWRLPSNVPRQASGALAASRQGLRYFGHWMRDDLTTSLVLQDWASLVAPAREPTVHQRDYLAAMRLDITPCSVTHFDELFVVDQNDAENAFKRARLREVRRRLRGDLEVRPHAGVMLLRGSSGQLRRLVNEGALAESLQRRGIDVLDPTQLSVADIIRRCAGAQVVIGVEGSQLSHGIVQLDDGGSLLVIQPPQRFNNPLKAPCDALGVCATASSSARSKAIRPAVDAISSSMSMRCTACSTG